MELLSRSALLEVQSGKDCSELKPTLQVLQIKSLGKNGFRIVLSDGDFYQQFLVKPENSSIIEENNLKVNEIIQLKKYRSQLLQNNKKVLIAEDIEALFTNPNRIGTPQSIERGCRIATPQSIELERRIPVKRPRLPRAEDYMPIRYLSPDLMEFTMKARLTRKSPIKTWKNERSSGKMFYIHLLDNYGDEIQGTFFYAAVDKFYETLQEGKVYLCKGGRAKVTKERFQTVNSKYSVIFENHSKFIEVEDDGDIEDERFDITKIQSLPQKVGKVVDVCGVVTEVGEVVEVHSKKGESFKKRNITLVDDSNFSVDLALWNEEAFNYFIESGNVMIAKTVQVCDFQGCSLSTKKGASKLILNQANIPQVMALKNWFNSFFETKSVLKLSSLKEFSSSLNMVPLREVNEKFKDYQGPEVNETYLVSGFVMHIKHDEPSSIWYTSCKNVGKCKKRVELGHDNYYKCEKCNETFENCSYCYMARVKLSDFSGSRWVTCFDNSAEKIIGYSAIYMENLSQLSMEEFDKTLANTSGIPIEGILKIHATSTKVKSTLTAILEPDSRKSLGRYLNELDA